jgi:hypothetical protein
MLNNIIESMKKWELPFLLGLFALNLYCAFMVNPLPIMEGGIDILHLSISAVMLMMAGERLEKKVKEK